MFERKYPAISSPLKVGNAVFRNRIFCSSHNHPQLRAHGVITDEGIAYYEARARGGCAQVSLGETPVDAVHAYKGDIAEHLQINVPVDADYVCQMSKLTRAIHNHGARISIELMHAGQGATDPIGPTGFIREDGVQVIQMDEALMEEVVASFAASARMARICGFDGVQLHGGHGWLLAQFVSPLFNKRTDEYSGSLENRVRFPIRVLKAVREAIGPDMLIEYRISGDEFCEGGYDNEEACRICAALEPYVDLFQISAGIYTGGDRMIPHMYYPHAVNAYLAVNIKKHVNKPVIAVGCIFTPDEAEELVAGGGVDFVAMARELIAEPEWVNKMLENRPEDITPCVRCLSCMSGEFGPPFAVRCTVNPEAGFEQWLKSAYPPVKRPKKVVVIGGGPAGMSCAVTAAERGHQVVLFEKEKELGGTLWFTDHDVFKQDLRAYRDCLIHRTKNCGARISLGVEATPELVEAESPDAVIIAVGASPVQPPIPGLKEYAKHALDLYRTGCDAGSVIMIGGGLVGCETALDLAAAGKKVTVVEMTDTLAKDGFMGHVMPMLAKAREMGVEFLTSTRCVQVGHDGIIVETEDGSAKEIPGDAVYYAAGMRPNTEIAQAFMNCAAKVCLIGDCSKAAKVLEAVHGGYFTAMSL